MANDRPTVHHQYELPLSIVRQRKVRRKIAAVFGWTLFAAALLGALAAAFFGIWWPLVALPIGAAYPISRLYQGTSRLFSDRFSLTCGGCGAMLRVQIPLGVALGDRPELFVSCPGCGQNTVVAIVNDRPGPP